MKNLRNRKWTLANRPVGMVGEHNFSYEEEEVRDIEDGEGGIIKIPGLPWKFSKTNCKPGSHIATRGMDNKSVLKNLGYSDKEIKGFYNKEVIAEGKF